MKGLFTVFLVAAGASSALASCENSACPPISGDILFKDEFQLYPAYFRWDCERCVVYLSAIFNATVVVWDPYKSEMLELIFFPGISHAGLEASDKRLPGTALGCTNGVLSVVIQAVEFFLSGGEDVSGDNFLIKYDIHSQTVLQKINLTATTMGQYGAFLDVEPGRGGENYVNGAYPASILRIGADNLVTPYYVYEPTTPPRPFGFGGLARVGNTLIANDNTHGRLVRFDLEASDGTPKVIPQTPYHNISAGNALNLPEKYAGTVLLQAEDILAENTTGVSVWTSSDGWSTANYRGFVESRQRRNEPPSVQLSQTTARQIGNRIYASVVYYDNPINPSMAGNRSDFSLVDITDDVEALLK